MSKFFFQIFIKIFICYNKTNHENALPKVDVIGHYQLNITEFGKLKPLIKSIRFIHKKMSNFSDIIFA